jgi:hypothetical protein
VIQVSVGPDEERTTDTAIEASALVDSIDSQLPIRRPAPDGGDAVLVQT